MLLQYLLWHLSLYLSTVNFDTVSRENICRFSYETNERIYRCNLFRYIEYSTIYFKSFSFK